LRKLVQAGDDEIVVVGLAVVVGFDPAAVVDDADAPAYGALVPVGLVPHPATSTKAAMDRAAMERRTDSSRVVSGDREATGRSRGLPATPGDDRTR
jgi:hypothetical protein